MGLRESAIAFLRFPLTSMASRRLGPPSSTFPRAVNELNQLTVQIQSR